MSNVAEILKTWADCLQVESILSTVLRSLGWGIIKMLAAVASAVEGIATSIYGILPTLLADSGLEELLADFRPLLIIILGLSITALGYLFIFKRPDSLSGHQIFQNFMLIFLTITVMPLMSTQVANFTTSAADEIFHTFEKDGIAVYQVIDNHLVDMRLLLEEGKLTSSETQRDMLLKDTSSCNVLAPGKEAVSYMQINEVLDYDNDDYPADQEELISQKISVNTNGFLTTVKMNRGFFDIGHEYYYRYYVKWGSLILTLTLVAITYVLAALKLSMIVWEVFLDLILSPFIAVTDIAGGQRIKAFLRNLFSLLAIICVVSLLLGGYGLGLKLLSSLEAGGSLGDGLTGTAMYLLLLAGLSWVVIFGPNIIESIFGVDAGLRNSYGVYRALKDAAAAPGRVAKKAAGAAKKGGKLLSGGGSREKNSEKRTERSGERTTENRKGKDLSAAEKERTGADSRSKGDKTGPRVQSAGRSRMDAETRNRENASQSTEQTAKGRSEALSRHRAVSTSDVSTKGTGTSRNISSGSSGGRTAAASSDGRMAERGRPSSSLQSSVSGNRMNLRSPHGGQVASGRRNSESEKPLQTDRNIRPELNNLRGSKPHADAVLKHSKIQKTVRTVPQAAENSNRILQNLKAERQIDTGRAPVINPDAQNFGKRKPKRK